MAQKKTSVTYETIMRDLKARKFAPIYILSGTEPYYVDKIADYLAEHVLRPEERDFNQTVVYGADVTSAQIADMARRYPMMAEHQVVIVKESQNLRNLEALEKYFAQPQMSTVLVFCHKDGAIDGRKKIYTVARNAGAVVFEGRKLYDRELPGFIETYLKGHKATIENKAAQMIADHVGADLYRLTSELDKILISLPEQDRRITSDIVEREVGVSKDFNVYELRSALVNRDVVKANRIIKYFNSNPKSVSFYQLIPSLFSYFQNLMIAYYAPHRNNENELARFLDLRNSWAVRDYVIGMRNYSAMKVMQILGKFREIDARGKGVDNVSTEQGELERELIFFILH